MSVSAPTASPATASAWPTSIPYYLPETNEHRAPRAARLPGAARALDSTIAHPRDLLPAFARVRGHEMAKAALEMAVCELWARREGEPLWRVLGGRRRASSPGVSIGLQRDDGGARRRSVATRGGGGLPARQDQDQARPRHAQLVEAVRRALPRAAADGRREQRLHARRRRAARPSSTRFDLMMIEQPLGWDDIVDHAALQSAAQDADLPRRVDPRAGRRAPRARARRLPHRQRQGRPRRRLRRGAARSTTCAAARGVPVWCGGMLESGIGRLAQRAPADAARLRAARRHLGQRALLRRGPGRSAGGGHAARDDRGAERPGSVTTSCGRGSSARPTREDWTRLSRSTAPTR